MSAPGPSSQQLHPEQGARFVFTRATAEDERPARWALAVYLHTRETLEGRLSLDEHGLANLELSTASLERPNADCALFEPARSEATKLARVLHRTPMARISRWRPLDA